MKKLTCIACAFFLVLLVKAQKEKEAVATYIATYKDLAIKEMIRSGIPASITLAQGILETQAGQSDLVKSSNNHFGIKCKTEWTGGKVYHDDDEKGECFRVYISAAESYKDHSDFLKNRPPYAFLFQIDPTNYEGWAKGLRKAGYATSPTYSQMLVKIIVDNNLQQYTLLALNKPADAADIFAASNTTPAEAPAATPAGMNSIQAAEAKNEEEASQPTEPVRTATASTTMPAKRIPVNKPAAPAYPAGLFKINETSVIYASAGTSLFAMANNYNVTYKKLLEFNELEEKDIIEAPQLVYLEKKPKKGTKDFHIVAPDETIEQISQTEGVRLESLLLYNHIVKGKPLQTGEKIYLRTNAPVAIAKSSR